MNIIRNNVQLVGFLGQNPVIETPEAGKKVAKFSIMCKDSYTNAEGKKVETTQWFNVEAHEGLATIAEKYMVKGKQVAISGKLRNRNIAAVKGGEVKAVTDIVATDILLLGGKDKS